MTTSTIARPAIAAPRPPSARLRLGPALRLPDRARHRRHHDRSRRLHLDRRRSAPPPRSTPIRPGGPSPWLLAELRAPCSAPPTFWTQVRQQHDHRVRDDGRRRASSGCWRRSSIARYEFQRPRRALLDVHGRAAVPDHGRDPAALPDAARTSGCSAPSPGVFIPQIAFQLPVTIIILVPFLRAIPVELEDAASIDGTSRFGFFWRIVLPLSGPGLVTVGVLAFVASWNAYLLPLLHARRPVDADPAARRAAVLDAVLAGHRAGAGVHDARHASRDHLLHDRPAQHRGRPHRAP